MQCTISGNKGDTAHQLPSCCNPLSFPIVMLATTFFKAVFFLPNPLSRLSPEPRSSSLSSATLPRAVVRVTNSRHTEQLCVGHVGDFPRGVDRSLLASQSLLSARSTRRLLDD